MTDDRICELGSRCTCVGSQRESCVRFHMPCPPIVRSKQDRIGTTRQAFDKRRDKMMREAERRIEGKVGPGGGNQSVEDQLYQVRRDPVKHLRKKGIHI